ncbi:MAG: DUF87 domain-containing protein [Acidobacteria bacterium]|nr:DUF87 domain-containing protein [Acidobacteriota bacterium]
MHPDPAAFEKLGAFYLGRQYDLQADRLLDDLLLYDSKDLTTHAMCVGMTGSGKTGLCVSLLEEAALDGVPALVIDPKGDLTNLLLTFPQLRANDFQPWVDPSEAQRRGQTVKEFAGAQAKLWREGLADWGQTGDRIARLREAADFNIYTPGSEAGRPLSILSSFGAPPEAVRNDLDAFREQVSSAATGLLALLGLEADPLRSREHILVSTLIETLWRAGTDVDLGRLIQLIQSPPIDRIGALDLESFYPADDRFELALRLNNLLAAPGFASWMTGEPFDIQHLLYSPDGKPRVSVLYIAHLPESERMFVVTQALNRMLAWMRSRSGTSSLRALLYMDEIFGYMPPVAEPPSKRPLLTLLKQARAFGIGTVLATQNPVDLDYKGLSNMGTWFLGRLQTERDKRRVLDGLEGVAATASGSFDRGAMEETLAGLGKRRFLMHNVHESAPVVFHTRWAMSYLRGPLTRNQIKGLQPQAAATAAPAGPSPSTPPPAPVAAPAPPKAAKPVLEPGIKQVFVPARLPATGANVTNVPHLISVAEVHFVDTRKGLQASEEITALVELEPDVERPEWDSARLLDLGARDLRKRGTAGAAFGELPAAAARPRTYASWQKQFRDWAYRTRRYDLHHCAELEAYSEPGEGGAEFRIRLSEKAREARDLAVSKLRTKYDKRFATLRERIRKAEQTVDREKEQASGAAMQTAINLGSTLLSAVLGRSALGRASSTARGAGYAMRQRQDVGRARENLSRYEADLADLETEFDDAVADVRDQYDPSRLELTTFELKPRRTDIDVRAFALAWIPCEESEGGRLTPLV